MFCTSRPNYPDLPTVIAVIDIEIVHFLHKSLDRTNWGPYALDESIMHPTRPLSSNNPGNNRPLPQNLWDDFDRSGMSTMT